MYGGGQLTLAEGHAVNCDSNKFNRANCDARDVLEDVEVGITFRAVGLAAAADAEGYFLRADLTLTEVSGYRIDHDGGNSNTRGRKQMPACVEFKSQGLNNHWVVRWGRSKSKSSREGWQIASVQQRVALVSASEFACQFLLSHQERCGNE